MSCLKVIVTREGGISSSMERVSGDFTSTLMCVAGIDGLTTTVTQVGGIESLLERRGGIWTSAKRKGGLSCKMWQVCTTSIERPYLEISPTVVWVLAGYTSNDVFSNTSWGID